MLGWIWLKYVIWMCENGIIKFMILYNWYIVIKIIIENIMCKLMYLKNKSLK